MNNLIEIKQLPIIEEQLKSVSEEIDKKVNEAKNLICTEENVKTIKQVRADFNKEFKELEVQRKSVKEQILAPYMKFEEIYETYISDKYKNADIDLKQKIDSIENELRRKKEQEIKDYFEEYKVANNIDFVTFEQAKINVTLTASKKSLKEQAKTFIDKIIDDLELIKTQEYKDEILVEYKQTLNVSKSIQEVNNRHKLLEEEKRKREELKEKLIKQMSEEADRALEKQEQQEQKIVHIEMNEKHEITKESHEQLENIFNKPLKEPVVEKQEEILVLKFTVKATKTKLKELKEFLINGGYEYE